MHVWLLSMECKASHLPAPSCPAPMRSAPSTACACSGTGSGTAGWVRAADGWLATVLGLGVCAYPLLHAGKAVLPSGCQAAVVHGQPTLPALDFDAFPCLLSRLDRQAS